jgi:hypothetical protein
LPLPTVTLAISTSRLPPLEGIRLQPNDNDARLVRSYSVWRVCLAKGYGIVVQVLGCPANLAIDEDED